jgi:hypothetical protein
MGLDTARHIMTSGGHWYADSIEVGGNENGVLKGMYESMSK